MIMPGDRIARHLSAKVRVIGRTKITTAVLYQTEHMSLDFQDRLYSRLWLAACLYGHSKSGDKKLTDQVEIVMTEFSLA